MKLALASSFKTLTTEEQITQARILEEGEGSLATLRDSAWSQMVASTVKAGSMENVDTYMQEYETLFKAATEAKRMPGWYRSNKSVITKALQKNVELLDDKGFPKGKSALEKEMRADGEGKTPIERITAAFGTIRVNMQHDDFTFEDVATVRKLAAALDKEIKTLAAEMRVDQAA